MNNAQDAVLVDQRVARNLRLFHEFPSLWGLQQEWHLDRVAIEVVRISSTSFSNNAEFELIRMLGSFSLPEYQKVYVHFQYESGQEQRLKFMASDRYPRARIVDEVIYQLKKVGNPQVKLIIFHEKDRESHDRIAIYVASTQIQWREILSIIEKCTRG